MIELSKIKEIYLFTGTTDFRLGLNGLTVKIKTKFHGKNINNMLFVFCSRKRDAIKIIEFEQSGTWLYYKKLNYGEYIYPEAGATSEITAHNLRTLLSGLDFVYKIEGKNKQIFDSY